MTAGAVAEMPDTSCMPAAPRVIGAFQDYSELLTALRARALELQASGEVLDEISGLARGYFQKLIGPRPPRRLGMRSLGDVLGSLAVRCVVIEDLEAKARIAGRLKKRDEKMVRGGTIEFRLTRRHMQKIQDKGRRSRWDAMTPAQRSEYARNLNRIRWHGAKAQNMNGRRASS
jgi:hypothetical protein